MLSTDEAILPPGRVRLDARALFALTVTFLLWGSAPPGIKAVLKVYAPGHVALVRFLLASVVLGFYATVRRVPLPRRADLPALAGVGLFGVTTYHLCLNFGLVHITSGAASLLVNTAPVFTALLAGLFLRERLTVWGWLGMGISFSGAALIGVGEGKGLHFDWGAVILLAAAVAWSLNLVMQKPLLAKYSSLQVTCTSLWLGTLPMLFFLPGLGQAVRTAPLGTTLLLVYLGVVPVSVAYVTWAYVLSRLPASQAANLLYCIPVIVLLTAWLTLGERPTLLTLAGGVIVFVGVLLVNARGRE